MLKFDKAAVLQEGNNGVGLVPQVEGVVDRACKRGYKNIFYLGIGGTYLYAAQLLSSAKQQGCTLPLFLENAADFCVAGNPHFGKGSLVCFATVSGDTPELVQAVQMARDAGAYVVGYVEKPGSPLAQLAHEALLSTSCEYFFWYALTFRLMERAGQFARYPALAAALQAMPAKLVAVMEQADEKARLFAQQQAHRPLHYLVGAGNLEHWAHLYAMCIMEEMQWMRTRPVSCADFFHGTLEVVEKDTSVILLKGRDKTRPLATRVEKFLPRVCANFTVFDTADYPLEGIPEDTQPLLCPMVMRAAFTRVSAHLENERKHPLEIRRYYRRLEY